MARRAATARAQGSSSKAFSDFVAEDLPGLASLDASRLRLIAAYSAMRLVSEDGHEAVLFTLMQLALVVLNDKRRQEKKRRRKSDG